jgi:hypothetical protein
MVARLRLGWQALYRTEIPLFRRLSGSPFFSASEPLTYSNRLSASNPALYHPVLFEPTNLFHQQLRKSLATDFGASVREKNFPITIKSDILEKDISVSAVIHIFLPNIICVKMLSHTLIPLDESSVFAQRQFRNHRILRHIANFAASLAEAQSLRWMKEFSYTQVQPLIFVETDSDDGEFLAANRTLLTALLINDPSYKDSASVIFDAIYDGNLAHNQKHEKIRYSLINKQAFLSIAPRDSAISILIEQEIRKKLHLFELGAVLQWFYESYPFLRNENKQEMDFLLFSTNAYMKDPEFTFRASYSNKLAWDVITDTFNLSKGFDIASRFDGDTSDQVGRFFYRNPQPKYADGEFWQTVREALEPPNSSQTADRLSAESNETLKRPISSKGNGQSIVWLHLSDLHLCPVITGWDADRVLEPLNDDFKLMEKDHGLIPDFLFFTGDLVFGEIGNGPGETISDQYAAAKKFLDGVRRSFSREIAEENVFIVPGNHDIQRSRATRDQIEWLENQKNLSEIIKLIQSENTQWRRYMERFGAYETFLKGNGYSHLLDEPGRLLYGIQRDVNGTQVGIAGINSAWSCCRNGEKGKLWLAGSWQIGHLRPSLKGTLFNIALLHHPLNWLVEQEDPSLQHDLSREFRFVLHGHEHQGWVHESVDGNTKISAAACYERSDHVNGYNFVRLNINDGTGEVWLRRYDREGGGWIPRVIKDRTDNNGRWPLNHLKWLSS